MQQISDSPSFTQLANEFAHVPVLSVYLPIRPGLNLPQSYRAEFLDLVSGAEPTATANKDAYDAAAARALDYVRTQYTPSGQTLALFATPESVRTEELEMQLPPLARFQTGAFVTPLAAAVEDNPKVAVVCVDQRTYRAVVAFLGRLEASEHAHSDVPGKQRQGGWAAARFEIEREHHVEDHIKDAARRTTELCATHDAKWLVLGGSNELTAMLKENLPDNLSGHVAGTFPVEMFASDEELLTAGLAVAAEAEAAEELALSREIVDKTLARANACFGWDETQTRLAEGRVHVLAMPRRALGSDAAELALNAAWDTGGRVEFIGPDAESVLQPYGGIGALLRY